MAKGLRITANMRGVNLKLGENAMKRGKYLMMGQTLADMNRFVPARKYDLRTRTKVYAELGQIVYASSYAKRQFNNQFVNYTTPGTGPRWDLKAKAIYGHEWGIVFLRGAGIL